MENPSRRSDYVPVPSPGGLPDGDTLPGGQPGVVRSPTDRQSSQRCGEGRWSPAPCRRPGAFEAPHARCERGRLHRFAGRSVFATEAVRELLKKRSEGFSHVTFTGGEPTLVKDFPIVLKCAKRMGYITYVTSNGQVLARGHAARRILPALDELCLSIHGPEDSVHDAMVRNPGSFKKISAVLRFLKSWPGALDLFVNTVVMRLNVSGLHGIMDLAARSGKFRHYIVSCIAPEGDGLKNFSKLAVPYSEIGKDMAGLCLHAKRLGVTLRFFGMPACVLGKHREYSNDFYFSSRVTLERSYRGGRIGLRQVRTLGPARKRVYLGRCRRCSQKGRCGGVFKRYLKEFGDAEFHEIPAKQS